MGGNLWDQKEGYKYLEIWDRGKESVGRATCHRQQGEQQ